jgi:hypothetical protein
VLWPGRSCGWPKASRKGVRRAPCTVHRVPCTGSRKPKGSVLAAEGAGSAGRGAALRRRGGSGCRCRPPPATLSSHQSVLLATGYWILASAAGGRGGSSPHRGVGERGAPGVRAENPGARSRMEPHGAWHGAHPKTKHGN